MPFSDLAIRQAKAYTPPAIDGLSLAVSASGGRTWHSRYYWLDRQKRMSLRTYPEVSLRESRGSRDEAGRRSPRASEACLRTCLHADCLGFPELVG